MIEISKHKRYKWFNNKNGNESFFILRNQEYSEGKIHKSEPEPGDRNVNTVYFINQARGNTRISRRGFFTMNEHTIANVY